MADLGEDPRVKYATTTGDGVTVDEARVGTDRNDVERVEVYNESETGTLYFRVDGDDPGVGGDGSYFVPPLAAREVPVHTSGKVPVKVISSVPVDFVVTKV